MQFHHHIHCIVCVDMRLIGCWILLKKGIGWMSKSSIVSMLASARQCNFISLPLNFVCMFLIALLRRSVWVSTTIFCIPSHQFSVPRMFVCFMMNPHIVFLVFTEAAMKISLIELPYGEHMSFNAPLDHRDLILLQNFRHAHVHKSYLAPELMMLPGCCLIYLL